MPELILFTEDGATRRHALLGPMTTVGRWPHNDLVLDLANVSRTHAMVIRNDDGFTVKDCDSRNGVYVNGRQVQAQVLVHGVVLTIGACRMRFIDKTPDAAQHSATVPGTLRPV